jgi:hypothetical protein
MEEIYGCYEILNRIQKEQNQSIDKNFPIQNKKLIKSTNIQMF